MCGHVRARINTPGWGGDTTHVTHSPYTHGNVLWYVMILFDVVKHCVLKPAAHCGPRKLIWLQWSCTVRVCRWWMQTTAIKWWWYWGCTCRVAVTCVYVCAVHTLPDIYRLPGCWGSSIHTQSRPINGMSSGFVRMDKSTMVFLLHNARDLRNSNSFLQGLQPCVLAMFRANTLHRGPVEMYDECRQEPALAFDLLGVYREPFSATLWQSLII